jgi:hypothetical protein
MELYHANDLVMPHPGECIKERSETQKQACDYKYVAWQLKCFHLAWTGFSWVSPHIF